MHPLKALRNIPSCMSLQDELVYDIVTAVAAKENKEAIELTPIHNVIDADALTELVNCDQPANIIFQYEGYQVTVCSLNDIRVTAMNSDGSAKASA